MCHVLIIEDEPIIALDLEIFLQGEGATSFAFAISEDEAVAAAAERQPDIITSDVTLIEGTGPAAVATIRAALGRIPVVYISATSPHCPNSDPRTRAHPKPFDRPALRILFRELWHLVSV